MNIVLDKVKHNIVFYGFRPQDSLSLHEAYAKKGNYPFRFPPHSVYMLIEVKRESYKQKSLRSVGMTEKFKDGPYIFDSYFESGNLDIAVKVNEYEYDLYMRADSNTRGHHQWFYFSVQARKEGIVRFNILNFTKRSSLYTQGMRIAVYSEKKAQRAVLGELPKLYASWHRGGDNITYKLSKLSQGLYQRAKIL